MTTATASFFDCTSAVAQRAKLIRVTRRALIAYQFATDLFNDYATAIHPDPDCRAFLGRRACHLRSRYLRLETALMEATGLPNFSILNDLSNAWPVVPRLMTANL